jgi:hypothetical protein
MTDASKSATAYAPSDALVAAALAAIVAPLPYVASKLFSLVPMRAKDAVVRTALAQLVPITLHSLAAARSVGGETVLIEAGKVSEEAQRSFVQRVAAWLVPDEAHALNSAFQDELQRLAVAPPTSTSWQLSRRDGRVILVTTGVSPVREHAGTVADALMTSFDALKELPKFLRRG